MPFFSVKISKPFKIFAVIGYFGWLGLCLWMGISYSEESKGSSWAPLWFSFWIPIIIYLIYHLLNPLYKKFSALTFERKMMLIVVLAIVLAAAAYTWSTVEGQEYYGKQNYSLPEGLPSLPGL